MKNVLLIKGQSQYDAMKNYIDEIEIGFRLAGYNTIILDYFEEAFFFQLKELSDNLVIDYIFTCNAIISDICEDIPNAVYITYMCDHPAGHRGRLNSLKDSSIVFSCDGLYTEYIKKYFRNIKYTKFVPLSGSYSPKYIPYSQRRYDVVFTGSYKKPEASYYINKLPYLEGNLKKFAEYMLNDIIVNSYQTVDECLKNTLKKCQIEVSLEEFCDLTEKFIFVDRFARNYYRDKIVRILIENGIKVHVFGNGWENFESNYLENLVIEKGDFYIARKAVANAKISLNLMPWFKSGFQERIATAMLSGTISVTDKSTYIEENFKDGEEIVTYSLQHPEEVVEKVQYLLNHEEEAAQIAYAGMQRAEKELTWQHRTFEMISYIQECLEENDEGTENKYGKILEIPYQNKNERIFVIDVLNRLEDILNTVSNLQRYDKVDLCDIEYLYNKFVYLYLRTKANLTEFNLNEYVYEYITQLTEEKLEIAISLFCMECMSIQAKILKPEWQILGNIHTQLEHKQKTQETKAQEILIRKILKNYKDTSEPDMQEILEVISTAGHVDTYNQKFVKKYLRPVDIILEKVHYDEQAEMCYVYIDGKKMYYPKGDSRHAVATQINFVHVEQDIDSPHCYLSETFQVNEGDIVIDAGVAEGNFALEIVEKAKKIYLVECQHKWIEALEKTFEPWKEKVVIVEKMLGDTVDDTHITIDAMVEEGYANFIKLNVEGAEMASLEGATEVLKNSSNIRCAICAYHHKNAEKDIRKNLEEKGFFTTTTKGYMFFKEDIDSWVDGELRRGLVLATK